MFHVHIVSPRRASVAAVILTPALAASSLADILRVPDDFSTVQAAVNAAAPGDTVEIAPGVWPGPVQISFKDIVLQSSTGDPASTVISGTGGGTDRVVQVLGGGPDLVIKGLGITGGIAGGLGLSNSDATVQDCRIFGNENIFAAGAFVSGGSPRLVNNHYFDNTVNSSSGGGSGIYVTNTDAILDGEIFEGNVGPAVVTVFNASPRIQRIRAIGNSTSAVVSVSGAGSSPLLISSELARNSGTAGGNVIEITAGNVMKMFNTTIVDNELEFVALGSDLVAANCIVVGNVPQDEYPAALFMSHSIVEGGLPGPGNLDVDPAFEDRSGGDFRLAPGSPAVDAGDTNSASGIGLSDVGGRPRFVNDRNIVDTGVPSSNEMVDIGAHERQRDIRYVDASAGSGGDGLAWDSAMGDLQDAITEAEAGDVREIWIAAGVYQPDGGSGVRAIAFDLVSDVAWRGGFAGDETTRESADPSANVSELNGNINLPNGISDDSFHLVRGEDVANAVIDGLLLHHSAANGGGDNRDGGGIWIRNADLEVRRTTFLSHRTLGRGSAVFADDSNLLMEGCIVRDNVAATSPDEGGAVVGHDSDVVLVSCVFNGNQTRFLAAAHASGSGILGVANCTVVHNQGDGQRAGLGVSGGANLIAINSLVWANEAPGDPSTVGLAVDGAALSEISHSVIQDFDASQVSSAEMVGDFDPRFADREGPDGIPGTSDDDLRLAAGSCVIDQGLDLESAPTILVVDVAGNPRRRDDLGSANGLDAGDPPIDAGAYEFTGTSCGPDVDQSGEVDFGDLLEVLSSFGVCEGCPQDLDCSDVVDFTDLLGVLSNWGPCLHG